MRTTLTAIAASLILALPAYADDAHHPDQNPAAAAATQPAVTDQDAALKQMQKNVTRMRSQLDRIGKAKTAAEKQKLMAEHMDTMQQSMKLGRGMMDGDMACPMMRGGGMGMMEHGGGMGAGHDHDPMMERMQQMEKRMDMMQMMMEQKMPKPQPTQ